MVLFDLLLRYRQENPLLLQLQALHVHHGWRQESDWEAQELSKMAQKASVPFHLETLPKLQLKSNVEDAYRAYRLEAFLRVQERIHAQGLLLAHHADDLHETVLKRLFEGARLTALGIDPVKEMGSLRLLRPLLSHSKGELWAWCKEHALPFFEDATNGDEQFLRARMRETLIPSIEVQFGKKITANLQRLGREAHLLKEYFERKIEPLLARTQFSLLGAFVEISFEEPLELEHYLHRVAGRFGMRCPRDMAWRVIEALQEEKVASFPVGEAAYIVHRKVLIFRPEKPSLLAGVRPLKVGKERLGPWQLDVEKVSGLPPASSGWRALFSQGAALYLPEGEYQVGAFPIDCQRHLGYSFFKKGWSEEKVPLFLRESAPLIWQDKRPIADFLRVQPPMPMAGGWKVTLQWAEGGPHRSGLASSNHKLSAEL
jgi:tRNA(Ile)-lysidine synthase